MAQHYTRNTVESLEWCKKCCRLTTHRVDDGRRGPCQECEGKAKPESRWPYRSHAALVRAGYLFRCEVGCRRCPARVLIYGKPGGGTLALECHTLQPHRWRCPPKANRPPAGMQAELWGGSNVA